MDHADQVLTTAVGTVLHGFCYGAFGRDSYDEKRVEAVGVDWVVARNSEGRPVMASGADVHDQLAEAQQEWRAEEERERDAHAAAVAQDEEDQRQADYEHELAVAHYLDEW